MSTVQESATGATPLESALIAGIGNISYTGVVLFERYVRLVLPLDGFVFWCKAAIILNTSSAYNVAVFNKYPYYQGGTVTQGATSLEVQGSLHVTTELQQNEDGSPSINTVIFTTTTQIEELNAIGPNEMFVANVNGTQFAFSEQYKFYTQAGVYHYRGRALYSTMDTQLINAPSDIDLSALVVSNSLPIWLTLNQIAPVYPSFAIPENLPPPYIGVHIEPSGTRALQSAPWIDGMSNHWQLASDRVKFTTYGLKNNEALDFQDYLFNESLGAEADFGVMNTPIMQDEKLNQKEFQILAQKKTFSLEVSYYQSRMQEIAQRYILSAMVNLTFSDMPV